MLHIFGQYFFPHIIKGDLDVPECHLDLIRELTSRVDGAIIFPRGFAKSTWEKIDVIHDLVYGLEDVILYIGVTIGDAGLHFESIKAELENNEDLINTYGNLVPSSSIKGRKWTNKHFETTNGVNVVARGRSKGRGVNIKNKRPTKIVIDDAEDDQSVSKPDQRAKFHDWLYNVIFPSKDKERGFIKMIGTVLHEMAEVLAFYKAHGGIFRRAIENGESIWPGRWTIEDLYRVRDGYVLEDGTRVKGIGTRAFNREYMNNPMASDEEKIKRAWLEEAYFVQLPKEVDYEAIIFLDPQAGQSKKADEFALTCLYAGKGTVHHYVVEQLAGRVTQFEQAKEAVRMWIRHKRIVRAVAIEVVLNQTAVWQTLADWKAGIISFNVAGVTPDDKWIDETDRNIPIMKWSPKGKDKVARLEVFEPDFERKEVHLMPGMEELCLQLMFLGTANIEHDDRADSLIGALEVSFSKGTQQTSSMDEAPEKGYTPTIAGNLMKRQF